MKTEKLPFLLLAAQRVRLPPGCEISGVVMEGSVAKLVVALPDEFPFETLHQCCPNPDWRERVIRTQFEGERFLIEEKGKRGLGEIKPMPEESDCLRRVGIIESKDPQAVFHVFEELQPLTKRS